MKSSTGFRATKLLPLNEQLIKTVSLIQELSRPWMSSRGDG